VESTGSLLSFLVFFEGQMIKLEGCLSQKSENKPWLAKIQNGHCWQSFFNDFAKIATQYVICVVWRSNIQIFYQFYDLT